MLAVATNCEFSLPLHYYAACLSIVPICLSVLGDRPGLPELQRFTTNDGNSLNLLQEIGVKYEDIGICLLEDETGAKMGAIKSDNQNVESKMRDIFRKWLQGII